MQRIPRKPVSWTQATGGEGLGTAPGEGKANEHPGRVSPVPPLEPDEETSQYPQDLRHTHHGYAPIRQSWSKPPGTPWNPGFWSRFPFWGLLSFILGVGCTGAAIAILFSSQDQPIDSPSWSGSRQPTVLLAYTSTIANGLLGVALHSALVVFFWRKAIAGTRITDLHYSWDAGQSVPGAFRAMSKGRAILPGAALLLVSITALLRGPLIQRASFVKIDTSVRHGVSELRISRNISDDWAGRKTGRTGGTVAAVFFYDGYSNVLRQYQNREGIMVPGTDCDNCTMQVEAFGFNVNCSESTSPYDYTPSATGNIILEGYDSFRVNITGGSFHQNYSHGFLNATAQYKSDLGCGKGDFRIRSCLLHPSVMKYEIAVSAGNATLLGDGSSDELIRELSLTYPDISTADHGTLPVLERSGRWLFDATFHARFVGARGWELASTGILSNQFTTNIDYFNGCNFTFSDPLDFVIDNFREIAFRMAIEAALEEEVEPQAADHAERLIRPVYAVNVPNLIVAVIVSMLGPALVFPLFWGWWALGRDFSLSPLEIANSFHLSGQHPGTTAIGSLLDRCNGNAEGSAVARRIGDAVGKMEPNVRYGVIGGESGRMGFGVENVDGIQAARKGDIL